jgi:hypothetical protein
VFSLIFEYKNIEELICFTSKKYGLKFKGNGRKIKLKTFKERKIERGNQATYLL